MASQKEAFDQWVSLREFLWPADCSIHAMHGHASMESIECAEGGLRSMPRQPRLAFQGESLCSRLTWSVTGVRGKGDFPLRGTPQIDVGFAQQKNQVRQGTFCGEPSFFFSPEPRSRWGPGFVGTLLLVPELGKGWEFSPNKSPKGDHTRELKEGHSISQSLSKKQLPQWCFPYTFAFTEKGF